jgi:hypothetical protein
VFRVVKKQVAICQFHISIPKMEEGSNLFPCVVMRTPTIYIGRCNCSILLCDLRFRDCVPRQCYRMHGRKLQAYRCFKKEVKRPCLC